ncbi:MAG: response regulator [Clostridiales bacterium]|nr:response regulator [Clostridiales bacterium]
MTGEKHGQAVAGWTGAKPRPGKLGPPVPNRRADAWRRCLALLFAAALTLTGQAVAAPAAAPGSGADAAGAGMTIRVGWFELPGYMETDAQGQRGGYVYEYLQDIARQTGWQYAFVPGEEAELREKLLRGEIDLLSPMFAADGEDGVLLSKRYVGVQHTALYTRVDSPLGEADYGALNGTRIGVKRSSAAEAELLALAGRKEFTPRISCYDTEEALVAAVRGGEVDAGATDGYQRADDLRALAVFAPRFFYFGIAAQKPDVARLIDDASYALQVADPYFHDRLSDKYLSDSVVYFTLTAAENAYLLEHPTLTVAYGPDWEPLLHTSSDGPPSGVAALHLDHLADLTGVSIVYVPKDNARQFDILCCVPQDGALAEQTAVRLSNPFLSLSLSLISRDGTAQADRAAADEAQRTDSPIRNAPAELVYYPGARLCLDAVLRGDQPAALLNSYAADSLLLDKRYAGLLSHRVQGAVISACFAVPKASDPRMLSILNKLISHISASELNDYVITSILSSQPISLTTIAARMPDDVLLLLASILILLTVLAILTVAHVIRSRRERAHTAEIAALLDYANRANDDVWELDIATHERWRLRMERGRVVRLPIQPLSGEVIRQFVHPDDLPAVNERARAILTDAFVETQGQEHIECRLLLEPGAYRWVRIAFQSMQPSPEHPHCAMVYITNVDEAVRAEEQKNRQLQDALALARAAAEAKDAFTAYISHEIRSPLNAVLGYLALSKASVNDPERLTDFFIKTEYAANHLLALVGDVLDMGSINSGRLQIAHESFDLCLLMETVASIYAAQARNRGLTYQVETAGFAERYLIGDDLRVKQVIVNLLSNAIKFTPEGGRVTLAAEQTAAEPGTVRVVFRVSDNGIGMSEEFQRHLFSAYVQQDPGVAGRFGGSGLGLSIAKRLIDLMGGNIAVVSAPGSGSTFTVTLDFPIDESKKNLVHAHPDSRNRFAGQRILLVEDNDMNMEIATELLKLEGGFLIESANNGRQAVERFLAGAEGYFDAILMDVRMPEMDGYEATRAIRRSDHPDAQTIPILAMTADAFAEDIRQATEAGMNGHISKPIDIHRLLMTLAEWLPRRKG